MKYDDNSLAGLADQPEPSANASPGNAALLLFKSCIADSEKKPKPTTFALPTPEGDVYVLMPQKGQTFEGFRLGEQVQVNGMRTLMVGSMKKMK
jgi:hypothetical protein